MPCVKGRSNPKLWEKAKKKAMREACASGKRRCGAWDARIAQRAGKIYRDEGGKYCGAKTKAQKSMTRWTREDWRTVTGEKACRKTKSGSIRCDRYLPAAAWKKLTARQVAETRKRKVSSRRQFVPNAPAAKRAGAQARRRSR
jgi:hypothetical protein